MQPILPVTGREPRRVVLAVDFPSLQGGLPVQGGWGYAMEDACVFDKADPLVDPGLVEARSGLPSPQPQRSARAVSLGLVFHAAA